MLLNFKYSFIYGSVKSDKFFHQMCIPLMITRRLAAAIILAALSKYTMGPLMIQAFICACVIFEIVIFIDYDVFYGIQIIQVNY